MRSCTDELQTRLVFRPKGGWAMKCNKRPLAVVSVLVLSLNTATLNARDADLVSLTFAAAQTAKQQNA
jgi:hypothetical protein